MKGAVWNSPSQGKCSSYALSDFGGDKLLAKHSMNLAAIAVSALVPLVVGSIWYNPKVFGSAWLSSSKLTEEEARQGNMPVIFGLTYIFSLMLSLLLYALVVHQSAVGSLVATQPEFQDATSELSLWFKDFEERFSELHRTFGHGAFHGVIAAIFLALPIVGILALFERTGGKYILVHAGYWVVALAIMGGILCAWV